MSSNPEFQEGALEAGATISSRVRLPSVPRHNLQASRFERTTLTHQRGLSWKDLPGTNR